MLTSISTKSPSNSTSTNSSSRILHCSYDCRSLRDTVLIRALGFAAKEDHISVFEHLKTE